MSKLNPNPPVVEVYHRKLTGRPPNKYAGIRCHVQIPVVYRDWLIRNYGGVTPGILQALKNFTGIDYKQVNDRRIISPDGVADNP